MSSSLTKLIIVAIYIVLCHFGIFPFCSQMYAIIVKHVFYSKLCYCTEHLIQKHWSWVFYALERKRKRSDSVLWQKSLPPQKNPKSNVTTQKRPNNFNYTTIADRLLTVSCSNSSHPTGAVKQVHATSTFQLTAKAKLSNETHFKIYK